MLQELESSADKLELLFRRWQSKVHRMTGKFSSYFMNRFGRKKQYLALKTLNCKTRLSGKIKQILAGSTTVIFAGFCQRIM